MTKVEHTKPHRVFNREYLKYETLLVTDAELVLIKCDMHESLIYQHKNGSWGITKEGIYFHFSEATFYKPILISRTEEIEVGDNYLEDGKIHWSNNGYIITNSNSQFKILVLPEHFSPEHLQDIVDGKLIEGKCLVECYNPMETFVGNTLGSNIGHFTLTEKNRYEIKLNPHITIYPVEEKMYTREDLKRAYFAGGNFKEIEEFEKWFEQNVK